MTVPLLQILLSGCGGPTQARPVELVSCTDAYNCLVGTCEVTNTSDGPQHLAVRGTAFPTAAPGSPFGADEVSVTLAAGESRRVRFGFQVQSYLSEGGRPRDCADLACVRVRGLELAFDCTARPTRARLQPRPSGWEVVDREPGRGLHLRTDGDRRWPARALVAVIPGAIPADEAVAYAQRAAEVLLPEGPQTVPIGSTGLFELTTRYDEAGRVDWSEARSEPPSAPGTVVQTASLLVPFTTLLSDDFRSVDLTASVRRCGDQWVLLGVAETQPVALIIDRAERGWSTRDAVGWTDAQPGFLGAIDCDADPIELWPEDPPSP